ncbi:MAG: AAA family ATPase [Candidatus Njordarchaeales archaeon]
MASLLENFEAQEEAVEGFSDINIFIGRNGSGKSTLLDAISLASSFINEIDSLTSKRKIDVVINMRTNRNIKAREEAL